MNGIKVKKNITLLLNITVRSSAYECSETRIIGWGLEQTLTLARGSD